MQRRRATLFVLLLVVGMSGVAMAKPAAKAKPAAVPPAPATTQPAAKPLTETDRLVDAPDERVSVLSNGLRVLLKAHRTAPVVTVRMYCQTGSIYEQEYLGSGMSHLFEHLLHGAATTTRSEEESRKILDDIGGNTNAFTSYDMTAYFVNTGKEHMETAISLLGDWITRPTFPQPAFEREWGVVQRELERDKDNPSTQLFEMTMQLMYPNHPARFPIIGFQPIVQKLTKADIVGYYHRMYVPDKIVICIVGDIDLDKTLAFVEQYFASFSRQKVPTIVLPEIPEMTTPKEAIKRMKVNAGMLNLAWPSIPLMHPDLYALDLLSFVLTQGDSSRLAREVRDKGLVFSIDSSSWTPAWARGLFAITARMAPEKLEAAKAAILKQVEVLQHDLVSPEELQAAKQQKVSEHVFSLQTAQSVGESITSDFLSTSDIHFSDRYVENIQKVTAEQLRDVAQRYLVPGRLGTVMVVPENYRSEAEKASVAAEPSPVKMVKLDNGLRVLIREDPTSPLVAMEAFSLGGVLLEDAKTNGLSRLAALLAVRGTPTRSAEDIARFFDARGGVLESTSATNTIYFQSQVLKKDFAPAFEVFADVVCNPSFPAKELEPVRQRVIDEIVRRDETWRPELKAFVQTSFFKDSPYRFQPEGSRDVVAAATAEQIAEWYRHLATGPETVVAIFGDVKADEAESLARKYFAKLPDTKAKLPSVPAQQPPGEPVLYIRPKPPTRDVAGFGMAYPGIKVDNPDTVPMAVLQTIVSGYRYPTGWLHEALRGGTQSLVYEVFAQSVPGVVPGYIGVTAACQPDKVDEVYRIVLAQFDKARRGDFTEGDLQQAKTIIATSEQLDNQTNSARAMQASIDELYGLGYDYRTKFIERVKAVTKQDVQKMAEKYFTVPTVAIITPAPDAAKKIGIKDVHVEPAPEAPKAVSGR